MRDPKKYTRSLIVCQSTVTITYIVIGIVVYYFCGSFVASPALGSAGVTMKKICYGLALPGLLVTVTIVSHVSTMGIQNEQPELTLYSSQRNISSSAFCEARSISRITLSPIGLSGSAALADALSLHTLSRALFRSLEDLYPLSELSWELSCPSSQWVSCGCTTTGVVQKRASSGN